MAGWRMGERPGLQQAATAMLLLIGGLLAFLTLAVGGSFWLILSEADDARHKLAPSITEQLRQAVLAAQLSRQAEVILNSRDRAVRSKAMREAEALAGEFAVTLPPDVQAKLNGPLHMMRRSAYRADLAEALAAAVARSRGLSLDAVLEIAAVPPDAGGRDAMPVAVRLHRLLAETADVRDIDLIEAEYRRLLASGAFLPPEAAALLAPFGALAGAFEGAREIGRVATETALDADRAYQELRSLTEGLRADADARTRGMADLVFDYSRSGLWVSTLGLTAAALALVLATALLRRHVLSPLRAAAGALATVRRERRAVALPPAKLREVDDLSRAVESFGVVLAELQGLAHFDSLTGLANRRLLLEHLRRATAQARRGGRLGAVMYLDLDGFKRVNDQRGHKLGDQLLAEVAERLKAGVRAGDLAARVGGDEFCIVLEDLHGPDDALRLAERIVADLSQAFLGGAARIGVSIGVVYFPADQDDDGETLLHRADEAMYLAKRAGKGCCRVWSAETRRSEAVLD